MMIDGRGSFCVVVFSSLVLRAFSPSGQIVREFHQVFWCVGKPLRHEELRIPFSISIFQLKDLSHHGIRANLRTIQKQHDANQMMKWNPKMQPQAFAFINFPSFLPG